MGIGTICMLTDGPVGYPPFESGPQHLRRSWYIPISCRQIPPEGRICAPLGQSCVILHAHLWCEQHHLALPALTHSH